MVLIPFHLMFKGRRIEHVLLQAGPATYGTFPTSCHRFHHAHCTLIESRRFVRTRTALAINASKTHALKTTSANARVVM